MDSITDKSGLLHQERILAVIGVLFLAPVILALAIGREHIILFYLAGVGACILVAFPRACLYLFMISVSIYYPYFVGRVGIHPCDICMLLLTASITLEFLLKGKSGFLPTRIDRYFLFLILATIISAVFAYKISYSIVPCFRIIVVFLSFRIVYGFAMNVSVRKLVNF